MKTKIILAAGFAAAQVGAAHAGGIDRSGQGISPLFEKGTYGEVTLGFADPNVSGTATASYGGAKSGNMAGSYMLPGFAFKRDFGNKVSAALIYDQPFGAKVNYPAATSLPAYFAAGATATLSTNALTGLVRYKIDDNFSVYGGARWQTMREKVGSLPLNTTTAYSAQGANKGAFGYVVGVAYEKPEIALRVALTYNSKISYSVPTREYLNGALSGSSTTQIDTPQSINLDAQTGINPTTLVFGSIRWVDWKNFAIAPQLYKSLTKGGSLVSYHDNTITYTLGVGHKFSDQWSGAVSVSYEPKVGGFASNLGPTDGKASIGLGATYTVNPNVKITAGVSYIQIGSAQTTLNNTSAASNFSGNHAVAAGVKVGFTF